MKRLMSAGVAALVALSVFLVPRPAGLAAVTPGPTGLLAMIAGPVSGVRDTNGDGLADAVAARVIVPAAPTADDVEAAANIAARLGYETTALTLPLVVRDDEVGDAGSRSACRSSSVATTGS